MSAELHTAFLAYRRAHGNGAALKLIKEVGGVEMLADVPEQKQAALLAAFTKDTSGTDDQAQPVPKSFADLDPKKIWDRFNSAGRNKRVE